MSSKKPAKAGRSSSTTPPDPAQLPTSQTIGQIGSHLVITKPGQRANLSIPQHKELSVGTLRALIRSAGITVEVFLTLL
ncbi:MAG: type II toxin-antitoxin system HicA family toxin [Acidobacteriota bacterium]|nr:type II toxin-antitoxin system HicA family toxin [Acidobacteriota bacterium]